VRVVDISAAGDGLARSSETDFSAGSIDSAAVRSAFQRLSVDDRTILLLHHLHGFSLGEVARQLRIPVGTAKSRLWGARRSLERALEAQG
jgi:RNA polymerase sigma-70 factor (ECF subfamily)